MNALSTPLEHHLFQRYSSSEEIGGYLQALATAAGPYATLRVIGRSALNRPLYGLHCADPAARPALRVLLVGSQHGASEAAGCEALLMLARAILLEDLQILLERFELFFIPNSNPDGREADSARNGNDVNLNRDFVLLSQPESRALDTAVLQFAPDVVLDAHESAIYKQKSLGAEGYLTTFEAQFDVANAPAIPAPIRDYTERTLLPRLIAAVTARGLHAQRYIREITSSTQAITHGGLVATMFRNKAGLRGPLTVLLETPMEPKAGVYPTFRNIGVRTEKQLTCMQALLEVVADEVANIRSCANSINGTLAPTFPLNGTYRERSADAKITIPLRRRDTYQLVPIAFPDHREVMPHDEFEAPAAYLIDAHTAVFADLLLRHHIGFEVTDGAESRRVERSIFEGHGSVERACTELDKVQLREVPRDGALFVPITQQTARLLPLLLEPKSLSSVFQYQKFARLLVPGKPHFVARALRQS